jgi:hypothetical protein
MKLADFENVKRFISTLPYYELRDVYINGTKLENYKAVCYQGTNKAVAIVSNKYKLAQHSTVFNIVLEKAQEYFKNTELKGWVEHTNTKAYLFLGIKEINVEDDSNYKCGLLITNSVNTELSIWFNLWAYRQVCSNGLVQRRNILEIQNKHLGASDFWDRFKSRLIYVLQEFDPYLKEEFTFYEQLKTITITPEQARVEILGKMNCSNKAYFTIFKQLKGTDTVFNLYQAITNYYTNTKSMNIASRVQFVRKARELIENYVRTVSKGE